MTSEMVNLCVDLRGEQFGLNALAHAYESIAAAGFCVERTDPGSDTFLAWIDQEFGGTWSSEAFAGKSVLAKRDGEPAGFASYAPENLQFAWLRGLGAQPGVGIFGPFGVAQAFRGSPIGPHLLRAALCLLRESGFAQALIPAVGHEKLIAYYQRNAEARVAETFDTARWKTRAYRTVALASGNGSNFQSLIDRVTAGSLPLDLTLLLSNKVDAYAIERARKAHIHTLALPWSRSVQPRAEYDAALLDAVRREEPDLVLLLGWMHVLPAAFVEAFPHILNIHPAFLPLDQTLDHVGFPDGSVTPAFRGARAVEDALAFGSRWVGASVHRVTPAADRGEVLVRKPLALENGESRTAIMERLHPVEHRVLAGGIMRWLYER